MTLAQQCDLLFYSDELLLNIFGRLDALALFRVGGTCRRFRYLCMDKYFWMRVCEERELPPFVSKTRNFVLGYLCGRVFAVLESLKIVKNQQAVFPSPVRSDFSATRDCGCLWKYAKINGRDFKVAYHAQGEDFVAFTDHGHMQDIMVLKKHELKQIQLSTSGYLSGLTITYGMIVALTSEPYTLCIINPTTLEGQAFPGKLVDYKGGRILFDQDNMGLLTLLNLESKQSMQVSIKKSICGLAKLIPGEDSLIFCTLGHLSKLQISKRKRTHLMKLPKRSKVKGLSIGPDGRYAAILLQILPEERDYFPPDHVMMILSLRERRVKFGVHLTSSNLSYSAIFFNGESVIIYGSRSQMHYKFTLN